MLLRICWIVAGVAIAVAGGLLIRHKEAASRFARREARGNIVFGRRLAEQNARRQTPRLMVIIGCIWIVGGAGFVWAGASGAVH